MAAATVYAYGPNPLQQLDFYKSCKNNAPLIVFIHGGAWWSGDKSDHVELMKTLTNRGFAAAAVNYRMKLRYDPHDAPVVQHPTHVHDVAKALVFLKNLPDDFYDHDQIHVAGHSAGAHIAMTLLQSPELQFIRGIVGVSGIYDIPRLLDTFPSYADFIVPAFGKDPEEYVKASPVHQQGPCLLTIPILLVHSKEDELVDTAQTTVMGSHLARKGAQVYVDLSIHEKHDDICQSEAFVSLLTDFANGSIRFSTWQTLLDFEHPSDSYTMEMDNTT